MWAGCWCAFSCVIKKGKKIRLVAGCGGSKRVFEGVILG